MNSIFSVLLTIVSLMVGMTMGYYPYQTNPNLGAQYGMPATMVSTTQQPVSSTVTVDMEKILSDPDVIAVRQLKSDSAAGRKWDFDEKKWVIVAEGTEEELGGTARVISEPRTQTLAGQANQEYEAYLNQALNTMGQVGRTVTSQPVSGRVTVSTSKITSENRQRESGGAAAAQVLGAAGQASTASYTPVLGGQIGGFPFMQGQPMFPSVTPMLPPTVTPMLPPTMTPLVQVTVTTLAPGVASPMLPTGVTPSFSGAVTPIMPPAVTPMLPSLGMPMLPPTGMPMLPPISVMPGIKSTVSSSSSACCGQTSSCCCQSSCGCEAKCEPEIQYQPIPIPYPVPKRVLLPPMIIEQTLPPVIITTTTTPAPVVTTTQVIVKETVMTPVTTVVEPFVVGAVEGGVRVLQPTTTQTPLYQPTTSVIPMYQPTTTMIPMMQPVQMCIPLSSQYGALSSMLSQAMVGQSLPSNYQFLHASQTVGDQVNCRIALQLASDVCRSYRLVRPLSGSSWSLGGMRPISCATAVPSHLSSCSTGAF